MSSKTAYRLRYAGLIASSVLLGLIYSCAQWNYSYDRRIERGDSPAVAETLSNSPYASLHYRRGDLLPHLNPSKIAD